jgi:hypothetical protein
MYQGPYIMSIEKLPTKDAKRKESERYLRKIASQTGFTFEELIEGLKNWITKSDHSFEEQDLELWSHFENVTGLKGKGSPFRCSCP